jgi:4'-phosphopantetheinyl transferase
MAQKLITRISKLKNFMNIKECRVDIWLLELNNICDEERELSFQLFDKEERRRAAEFSFMSDRDRFILCRGLSKIILGAYCCSTPAAVQISYGEYGKPYLPDFLSIHFNISHTHNCGVICVSRESVVGVDIEYMDETVISHDVLTIFSSKEEQDWVYERNIKERFFTIFTCKEALLKAQGIGFLGGYIPSIKFFGNKKLSLKQFHYGAFKIYSKVWNKEYIISICLTRNLKQPN